MRLPSIILFACLLFTVACLASPEPKKHHDHKEDGVEEHKHKEHKHKHKHKHDKKKDDDDKKDDSDSDSDSDAEWVDIKKPKPVKKPKWQPIPDPYPFEDKPLWSWAPFWKNITYNEARLQYLCFNTRLDEFMTVLIHHAPRDLDLDFDYEQFKPVRNAVGIPIVPAMIRHNFASKNIARAGRWDKKTRFQVLRMFEWDMLHACNDRIAAQDCYLYPHQYLARVDRLLPAPKKSYHDQIVEDRVRAETMIQGLHSNGRPDWPLPRYFDPDTFNPLEVPPDIIPDNPAPVNPNPKDVKKYRFKYKFDLFMTAYGLPLMA